MVYLIGTAHPAFLLQEVQKHNPAQHFLGKIANGFSQAVSLVQFRLCVAGWHGYVAHKIGPIMVGQVRPDFLEVNVFKLLEKLAVEWFNGKGIGQGFQADGLFANQFHQSAGGGGAGFVGAKHKGEPFGSRLVFNQIERVKVKGRVPGNEREAVIFLVGSVEEHQRPVDDVLVDVLGGNIAQALAVTGNLYGIGYGHVKHRQVAPIGQRYHAKLLRHHHVIAVFDQRLWRGKLSKRVGKQVR